MQPVKNRKRAAIKAALLVIFIVTAIVLVRLTSVTDCLTAEQLGLLLKAAGFWAPLAYVAIYTAGVCLFMPGTLLAAGGAAIFGPHLGFVYVWTGALLGSSLAFFIGRYLGREFSASLIGDKSTRYDDAIERNGFATVLYLRLVYFPFTPMNFGMGLTKVRFWDYFFGTAFGIVVGTFILTFFFGTVKDIWASGDWTGLISWKVMVSLSLFVFSFFIPKVIKRMKPPREVEAA
jgi:uncharacterized membrane protein YdjX (TVP38/TMEM64 family)